MHAASAHDLAAEPLHCGGASLVHATDDFLQAVHCQPLPAGLGAIAWPPKACGRAAVRLLGCFGLFSFAGALSFFAVAVNVPVRCFVLMNCQVRDSADPLHSLHY